VVRRSLPRIRWLGLTPGRLASTYFDFGQQSSSSAAQHGDLKSRCHVARSITPKSEFVDGDGNLVRRSRCICLT
jgi:hypothetical protein